MKSKANSNPVPGELRKWKDRSDLFLVTHIGTAPNGYQSLDWSSDETNACFYIDSDGAEQWHYIEVIAYESEVISDDEFCSSKTTT